MLVGGKKGGIVYLICDVYRGEMTSDMGNDVDKERWGVYIPGYPFTYMDTKLSFTRGEGHEHDGHAIDIFLDQRKKEVMFNNSDKKNTLEKKKKKKENMIDAIRPSPSYKTPFPCMPPPSSFLLCLFHQSNKLIVSPAAACPFHQQSMRGL